MAFVTPLRTFKLEQVLVSTFEQDPIYDPEEVSPPHTGGIKFGVLYPTLLNRPLHRNPIPLELRTDEPVRGFPIRAPLDLFPWCPYLPAVLSYGYPIFKKMNTSPTPTQDGTGGSFVLDPSTIHQWSAVEHVMRDAARRLEHLRPMGVNCSSPKYPSEYGYKLTYRRKKDAVSALKNSLNAFQQILAYCSYSLASIHPSLPPINTHVEFFKDPTKAQDILDGSDPDSDRSLAKLLWASVGEIQRARNFIGVIITHQEPCDPQSLSNMHRYGVPVYVRWPNHPYPEIHPSSPNSDPLSPWRPPNSTFATSRQSPTGLSDSAPSSKPPPPTCLVLDHRSQRYPWEYVEKRKAKIAEILSTPNPSNISYLGRQKNAQSFGPPGLKGGPLLYQFDLSPKVDQTTGEEIQEWVRTPLTRSDVIDTWETFPPNQLWFDCVLNEWNYCGEFDFKEHVRPSQDESDSDGEMGWYRSRSPVPPPQQFDLDHPLSQSTNQHQEVEEEVEERAVENLETQPINTGGPQDETSISPPETLDHTRGHLLIEQIDAEFPSADQIEVEVAPVDQMDVDPPLEEGEHPEQSPAPKNVSHIQAPDICSYNTVSTLINLWKDPEEFLYKRYGLTYISRNKDEGQNNNWCLRLGLKPQFPDVSMVELYHSFVDDRAWPPSICDLSPNILVTGMDFPTLSPKRVLSVSAIGGDYLLSAGKGLRWKLLVRDPLTVLQIERELWDVDSDSLVVNLVKKGLPFEVLNQDVLQGAAFYPHPGPTIHPTGAPPGRADHLIYRGELATFFIEYPHAYAAALCAGGILWRIAVDVLPLPTQEAITRIFHSQTCFSRNIDGKKYWTPRLTTLEEHVVVGMYSWAESALQSPREDTWWPKPRLWAGSGLDFGAWAPLDEEWYQSRCTEHDSPASRCIRPSQWKNSVKYAEKPSKEFLQSARSLASSFLAGNRL